MAKRDLEEAGQSFSKRAKLLDSDDEEDEGQNGHSLNINKEYAVRFEHNKQREEKHRLEEKYGSTPASDSDDESSSEDDEAGELITDDIDKDIFATIKAIKAKDPRIYDGKVNFFDESGKDGTKAKDSLRKEKPMRLQDYHRQNLLEGRMEEDEEKDVPISYAQEQQELKKNIVKQMHDAGEEDDEDEDDFMIRKSKPEAAEKAAATHGVDLDITHADKDPETFLSNFLTSNVWRASSPSRFQPFDSDDEDELERADEFEEAYNRRFEDPKKSNVTLQSHSRDIIAKYSVRRDEATGRQKARQAERARKDAEKLERGEEKARLKRLKADEMERKVRLIRKSAGAHGKDFQLEEWAEVLDGDFDDDQWEAEMQRRFGEDYYAADDMDGSEGETSGPSDKKKIKKPKWDDDIDLKDLGIELSDEEIEEDADDQTAMDEEEEDAEENAEHGSKPKRNIKRERAKAKEEAKRTARRDRRLIENLVEQNFDLGAQSSSTRPASAFRYRETSPKSFGMTARDILLASDADLNQFAGLKKLHAFRDDEKKRKDKKNLSKKARLRQWRKETFGNEDEPAGGFERLLGNEATPGTVAESKSKSLESGDEAEPQMKKKRKRSKKSKATVEA